MVGHVLSEKAGGVLTLTLNRPEKKNALTRAMYATLGGAIDGAADDADVRCVLIQANGDMFTAGNDVADFAAASAGGTLENAEANPLLAALARAKTPLVAAVHGRAVGVGTTMLLHCDLVYVAQDALLTTPFVNLALVPEAASSLLLPARIGHARAFEMFVLGRAVDGVTAAAWGIANAAVPASGLRAAARAGAEAIAAKPPSAVTITKALMREAAEAFAAFTQKRAPDFSKVS